MPQLYSVLVISPVNTYDLRVFVIVHKVLNRTLVRNCRAILVVSSLNVLVHLESTSSRSTTIKLHCRPSASPTLLLSQPNHTVTTHLSLHPAFVAFLSSTQHSVTIPPSPSTSPYTLRRSMPFFGLDCDSKDSMQRLVPAQVAFQPW